MRTLLSCLILLCLPIFSLMAQTEQIKDYETQIRVHSDASLTIQETITVFANKQNIKRGIYRNIPLTYKDTYGNKFFLDISVLGVKKDGRDEPFHIEQTRREIKIYAGSQNVFLNPGEYQYEITYQVKHAISYFKDYDELYWNVTGNEWQFPILNAKATVFLPQGAKILQHAGYTGPKGAKGHDFVFNTQDNTIEYSTLYPLNPREGLTIAVAWPKGLVYEPSASDKFFKILQDNGGTFFSLIGFLLILGFYGMCWVYVGRDPAKGTIIPLFEPPEGFSPAVTHFISHMGFKTLHNAFTAALVNLGVKGFVKIKSDNSYFSAQRIKDGDKTLGVGEQAIMQHLFKKTDKVTFKPSEHNIISSTLSQFKSSIKKELSGIYFKTNRYCFVMAFIFTILYVIGWLMFLKPSPDDLFLIVWITFWSIGVTILINQVILRWNSYFSGHKDVKSLLGALYISVFALPFLMAEVFVLFEIASFAGWLATIFLILTCSLHAIFWELLKRPTLYGRKVMDKIDGFKLFLQVANKDELDSFKSPELTPELFESYLPYAMALGLEKNWSQRFESTLKQLHNHTGYSPTWYSGARSFSAIGAAALATSLSSSLSSSIQSSSSSGGSSGGGSSGGGGGGGGGGGW